MNKILYSIFLLLAGIVNGASADAFYFQEEFTVPVPPSNANAEPLSFSEISVSWDYHGDEKNINHFYVERVEGNVPFEAAERLKFNKNIRSIVDENLKAATTYIYRVIASNPDSDSEPSNEAVATTLLLAPNPPSGLTAEASSPTEIVLNWTHDGANYDGFRIESSSAASGPFTEIGIVSAGIFTFSHNNLTPATTYYYRVIALNGAEFSDPSGVVSATTEILATAPAAPSGLTATSVSATQISLSWTDNSDNETAFVLQRSETAGSGFIEITRTAANVITFQNSGLNANTTYYYRVQAVNATGESAFNTASGTTDDVAPTAPSGLQITSTTANTINLSWTDNSTNETAFVLERSETSASAGFAEISRTAANIISFEDTGLASNKTYYYRIKAINSVGDSQYATVSGKTNDVAPAAPSGLTVTTTTATSITLGWTDNSTNETAFVLERSETSASAGFAEISRTAANIISFEDTGLASNKTYYYRIKAINSVGDSQYATASGKTNDVAPAAPSGLAITSKTAATINLSWTDNSINEANFILEKSLTSASSGFSLVSTLTANTTTFQDTDLISNTTYYYRVKATNAIGESVYSSVTSGKTDTDIPLAPSNLTATDITTSSLRLSWTDNASNETGFEVERSTQGATGFTVIAELPANTNSFLNEGLASNTTYFYRVRAVNKDGASYSNTISPTTEREAGPPAAPSLLEATAVTTFQINLTWRDNSDNETSFVVERSLSETGPFSAVVTLPANTSFYENTGLESNTTYYYRVKAKNIDGEPVSNISSATTKANPTPPTAPTGLSAVAVSTVQINLTWIDNSNSETNFTIQRSLSLDGPYLLVASVGANVTSYQNFGLISNTTYYYRVRAESGDGVSAFTNIDNAKTSQEPKPPTAPSSLTAKGVSTIQINLEWVDNSNSETNFVIERSNTTDGPYSFIAAVGANVTSYQNTGLSANTKYFYKVRAINNDGTSGFSNIASATTPLAGEAPTSPSNLEAIGVSTTQINLTWIDNSENESNFVIHRSSKLEGPFTFLVSLPANQETYENTGLEPNTTFYYQVRASNVDKNSPFSNVAQGTTSEKAQPPAAPDGLTALAVSTTQITLRWNDKAFNETVYEIERSTDGETFTIAGTVEANDTVFQNFGLTPNTEYTYRVRAQNGDGVSEYSNLTTAVTLENEVPPIAPSDLFVKLLSQSDVELFWTDNSVNEEEFIVERAELETEDQTSANFAIIKFLASNTTNYIDSGLEPNSIYKYRVQAKNSDGSTFSNEVLIITSISGNPIITTISINYPKYFENTTVDTTVSIKVAEPGLYSAVKFYYRGLASNLYKERVVDINENLYAVSIAREDLDEMGLEYYFEATGVDGQTYVSNVGRTYLRYEEPGLVLENLKFGETVADYQMVSIPLNLDQKSIIGILEDDLGPYDPAKWRLFHYKDGTMLERGAFIDILPGKGYWLIMKEESQLNTGAGNVVEVSKDEPFKLELNQGWNQIGNPYMMDLSWEDVLVANGKPAILSDSIYTFNGSYRLTDSLNVFQGGYVFAERDTTLFIPLGSSRQNNGGRYNKDNSKTNSILDSSKGWNLDIHLAAKDIIYNLAGLGMREDASDSKDRFDRIALPKFADYIDINFSHPEYFASNFTKDVVPLQESYIWDMNVLSSQGKRPTTISWSRDVGIPSHMNLVLFDVEKQRKVNMREQNSYVVSGEEVKLQVYYGNDKFIDHELKAYGVNIGSIYPNPFSENFVIPIALPNANTLYTVKLHLFNNVGKEVRNNIEFTIGGGFHDLEVSHNHIKELTKGLYFYRLEVSYDGETLKERSGKIIKK